eukprot:CAMPEP_0197415034 /NCGR_PEP_ID=MMETSP1170-20131217/1633_1 /TAXON_ID=54406 /ORGANISM="Sarcinochrysis sp, Strain CCMP770" /LENGTH=91 /DNA_ID=CAMNT_0042941795 /DNA_START=91 /DNA_END=363 /DNA_ORIENTATION=+
MAFVGDFHQPLPELGKRRALASKKCLDALLDQDTKVIVERRVLEGVHVVVLVRVEDVTSFFAPRFQVVGKRCIVEEHLRHPTTLVGRGLPQ